MFINKEKKKKNEPRQSSWGLENLGQIFEQYMKRYEASVVVSFLLIM